MYYILDFTCKCIIWYLSFSDLFHLVWYSQVHPCYYKWHYYIYYGWLIFCCVYVHLYPFICVLAIINTAAMNIGMHVSFWIMTFSGYMSNSGIKGPYGNSIFSFLRNLHTVLHSDCTNYISTNSVQGLSFLHTLSNIYYV